MAGMDRSGRPVLRIKSWVGTALILIGTLAVFGDASSLALRQFRPPTPYWQTAPQLWTGLPFDLVLLIAGCHVVFGPMHLATSSIRRSRQGIEHPSEPRRVYAAFGGTIAACILYAMSTGPAVWMLWNVRLPEWAAYGFHWFYLPLKWFALKSQSFVTALGWHNKLWIDPRETPATPPIAFPYGDTPSLLSALSAVVLGAWLIASLIRWLNRRDLARNGMPPWRKSSAAT